MPIEAIVSLLQALAAFAPRLPEIVTAVDTAVTLMRSGKEPTAEQIAAIDLALEIANAAVQAA